MRILIFALMMVAFGVATSPARAQAPSDDEEPPVPEPVAEVDESQMRQLFQNLIGNAVKFRRPGEAPRIDIEFARSNDPATIDQWLISVSDNGIGIADEFVDKVFVIFQRLHGRDAYAGTGIGLALCKKIVEYHGGTIWIDKSYQNGTRFYFTLPLEPARLPPVEEGSRV